MFESIAGVGVCCSLFRSPEFIYERVLFCLPELSRDTLPPFVRIGRKNWGCEFFGGGGAGRTSADVLPSLAHEEELISLAIGRIGARAPLPHHNCGNTIERFVAYLMFAKAFEKPSDVYPCGL